MSRFPFGSDQGARWRRSRSDCDRRPKASASSSSPIPRSLTGARSVSCARLSAVLAEEAPACARLVLGDLVADQPGLYAELREVLAADGSLLLTIPGNHDFEPKAREGEDPFRSFRAIFGGERYAFQCGRMGVLM